jgi:polyisoprenoid-binding protein YceI
MKLSMSFAAGLALSLVACSDGKPPAPPAAAAAPAPAAPAATATALPKGETTYYFGANPARTKVIFESKTNVTNILGQTNLCSGSATIDFDKGAGSCHLVIPTLSLNSGMDDRDRAMHGKVWLDSKVNKTIEFKSKKATFVQPATWKIDGDFLFRGVTVPLSIEAEVKQVPPSIGQKLGDGAWIRVRTAFKVDITQHGIKIDKSAQFTVEPVWNVGIELFATTVKPADAAVPVEAVEPDEVKVVRVPKLKPDGLPGTHFEFGKKPQLTTLRATSEAPIETIVAQINASHGYVGIDKEKGLAGLRFHIPVGQIKTGIPLRDEHLRGETWLDEKKFPMIGFESTKATKKDDKTWTVEGTFTMRGVGKPLKLDVAVADIAADEVKKANWGEKPGVRVTGDFKLKLSDHGVKNPDPTKINDELSVSIFLVGLLADEKQ